MVSMNCYPAWSDIHRILMEGNTQFIELHKLLKSQLWKAKKRWNLLHDDVIKSICVVASDAVSNTQLPEEFDASVTIIAKALLIGLRGSLTPLEIVWKSISSPMVTVWSGLNFCKNLAMFCVLHGHPQRELVNRSE
jgi:hypothetical protein